jgi:transcriptional regulator with XRE-family HTH domain
MSKPNRGIFLKKVRKELGLTQSEVSETLGITQSAYSGMERGTKSALTIDHYETLIDRYGINPLFLLKGELPLFSDESPTGSHIKGQSDDRSLVDYENAALFVPVKAQAGYVASWPDIEGSLQRVLIPGMKKKSRVFEVAGNSMHPLLMHGDYVVCSPIENRHELRHGLIYVLVSRTQGITVKYVHEDKYALFCTPHNPDHKAFYVPFDEAKELWEVRMRVTEHLFPDRISAQSMVPRPGDTMQEIADKMIEIGEKRDV